MVGTVFLGRDLVGGVAARMDGNLNIGQFHYYVLVPAYVVMALLSCAWGCNTLRRGYFVLGLFSGLSLMSLLPFLLPYSGGV